MMIARTEGSRPSFVVPLLPHLLTIDFSNRLFVRFPMEDNKRLITVHIAVGWLKERADRDRRRTSNLALLFNFYRDEIEGSKRRRARSAIAAIAMGRTSS